jgi:hypothetical protein
VSGSDQLKKALETYEKNRLVLASQGVGRFVLIYLENIEGVWDTYEDALKAGYEKYGVDGGFLVKKILGPIDGIQFFTRDLGPCQPSPPSFSPTGQ